MASQQPDAMRVIVAGGGVAGIEAILALGDLAGERADVCLLTPGEEFVYRPLLVAEPFGAAEVLRIPLRQILAAAGAEQRRDTLAAVDPAEHTIATSGGATLEYDALVVAPGAAPVEAVPGALSFGKEAERAEFAAVLAQLGGRRCRRIAFVVPREASWSIAAYELALLTAAERDARRLPGVEITVVTHEPAPLHLFGDEASQMVAAELDQAGISLVSSTRVERFAEGELIAAGADPIAADLAVALPALRVAPLPGLPQREGGFVPTDVAMQVEGLSHVWAAGDVTWFPIKQGGLAAQQADVAAHSIAARAGARVPLRGFQPVLRGELITGGAPAFFRATRSAVASDAASGTPLWWPPTKIAAEYLGPYVERLRGESGSTGLLDRDPTPTVQASDPELGVSLILAAADANAEAGDYRGALDWLSFVEQLNLVIPPQYVARRFEWERQLRPDIAPGAAAARIDPTFKGARAALTDIERRLAWLRAEERRSEGEMKEGLETLDGGMKRLKELCQRSGILRQGGR